MASKECIQHAWVGPSLAAEVSSGLEASVANTASDSFLDEEHESPFSKFANVFRYLGGAALILAGVIYMFQGLEDVSQFLRQWVWLGLIAVMGVAGYLCRILMDDVKSARIFFILATALISVQFSQLGGMLFDIVQPTGFANNTEGIRGFWSFQSFSFTWFLVDVGLSTVLAAAVSFIGFAILLRKSTIVLSLIFIALNALILLPGRDIFSTVAVIFAMALLLFAVRWKVFQGQSIFRSMPGRMVRALLIFPLVIVFVRNSFHVDTLAGICVLSGLLAGLMVYGVCTWFSVKSRIREILMLLGGALAVAAWSLYAPSFSHMASSNALYLLPVVALLFELSRLSSMHRNSYRNIACGLGVLFCVFGAVVDVSLVDSSVSLILGVIIASCGFVYGLKIPLWAGAVMALVSFLSLLISSLSNVSLNIWLFFAIGGVFLVLFSSVVEKYGVHVMNFWRYINTFE